MVPDAWTPNESDELARRAGGKALLAGWLCFGTSLAMMVVSLALIFVYAPLMIAAFVLSIVALAQRRIVGGVILLLLVLVMGPLFWIGTTAMHVGGALHKQETEKANALARVELEELNGHIDGSYMYCKGKVRNLGTSSVKFVKVQVEWLDKSGNILDTDFTYAVGGEELAPGAAKSFSMMTPADHRMKRYRCVVLRN